MRRRTWVRGAPGVAALLGALLAWAPGPLRAQRALVLPQPQGTAVGVSVTLSAGGGGEADAEAGASRLAAEAIVEAIRPELAALGATARVECERSWLRVTLLAPAPTWRVGTSLLLDAIFHPSIAEDALERARARLERTLRIEEGNPAEEIRVAVHEALFGLEHRWARARCGVAERVDSLSPELVARVARARFAAARATAAVVGPVDRAEAQGLLRRALGPATTPVSAPAPNPPPMSGSRTVDAATVTSWVAVAYRLPADADEEAVRLLGWLVTASLEPAPQRPGIVDVSSALERWGGGGALVIYAITAPERARECAARIQELVEEAAGGRVAGDAFRALLRRYRGERLLALAAPEARAAEASLRLFLDHGYEPVEARIDALTAERLRGSAERLGAPAVAILGPSADGGGAALDRGR
ncbi:MAG: insulinase family protein [Gemmatimonadetes bacterium]|nr:insulinase family protein [Gemmatimonadota bacterium]